MENRDPCRPTNGQHRGLAPRPLYPQLTASRDGAPQMDIIIKTRHRGQTQRRQAGSTVSLHGKQRGKS